MYLKDKNLTLYRGVLSAPAGSGLSSAPGSGATVTLWDSTATGNQQSGLQVLTPCKIVRFQLTIVSSHDSGTNGVVVEGSEDGSQWDNIDPAKFPATYSAVSGRWVYDVLRTTGQIRFKYTNSANALTKWQTSLEGSMERASPS